MKKYFIFLLLIFNSLNAQTELINLNDPVYTQLKYLSAIGQIKNYNDMVLPISRVKVLDYLSEAYKSNPSNMLKEQILRFSITSDTLINFLDNSKVISDVLLSQSEKSLLSYHDSTLSFAINPVFSGVYINNNAKSNAELLIYGGSVRLNYGNNITAFLEAWNGYMAGDLNVARLDKRVNQSYSVNNTNIKYFDGTRGYINYEDKYFSAFMGRNEIIWGANKLHPLILGNSSQIFDYMKFSFNYKKFNYTFLHGWLVQPKTTFFVDSLIGDVSRKNSKYIAINRIGFNPYDNLKLGVSQSLIYANRPLELAYFNPFLLWESAQRSQNDLDNSFLNFDVSWLITAGFEVISSVTFDDINFNLWGEGNWNTQNNRIAWQAGFNLAYPYLPENMLFNVDYIQIRPFTFSHPEIGESLSYTNNGFPLGVNLLPNSISLSAKLNYLFSSKFSLSLRYDYTKHGDNLYDNEGNLLFNNGGSYFLSTTEILSSKNPKLLDGVIVQTDRLELNSQYIFSYNINFNFVLVYQNERTQNYTDEHFNTFINVNYNIF